MAALSHSLGAAPAIAISIVATQTLSGGLLLFAVWLWRFANRPAAHV
jgi:hypothetical protein